MSATVLTNINEIKAFARGLSIAPAQRQRDGWAFSAKSAVLSGTSFFASVKDVLRRSSAKSRTETATASEAPARPSRIRVMRCDDAEGLKAVYRMRYEVYCEELGRTSPHADKVNRTLSDKLDAFGYVFVAFQGKELVGTLRVNVPTEGDLGQLEEVYGMRERASYPNASMVCTKLIVKQSRRGGLIAKRLVAAAAQFALERGITDCFMDCIPKLEPLYRRMGFERSGEGFVHEENGPSLPLMIDAARHAPRLATA